MFLLGTIFVLQVVKEQKRMDKGEEEKGEPLLLGEETRRQMTLAQMVLFAAATLLMILGVVASFREEKLIRNHLAKTGSTPVKPFKVTSHLFNAPDCTDQSRKGLPTLPWWQFLRWSDGAIEDAFNQRVVVVVNPAKYLMPVGAP